MGNDEKIAKLKEERQELLASLKEALESDLNDVKNSNKEDLEFLIDALIDSEYEISKLDKEIDFVSFVIAKRKQKEKNLKYISNTSKEELINNALSRILIPLTVEKIFVIITMLSSPSYEEFIKRAAVIVLINLLAFEFNYNYLSSNYSCNKAKEKLNLLRDEIYIDSLTKDDLESCKEMYVTLTKAMNDRIFELAPEEIHGIPFKEVFDKIKQYKMRAYLENIRIEEKLAKKKKKTRIV